MRTTAYDQAGSMAGVRSTVFIWLALGTLLFAGCRESEPASRTGARADVINVVATTSIVADVVRVVGGEHVQVEALMGPGVDPHLYNASEGDVMRMASADVVLYNGLHLEGKMTEVFEQMRRRGKPTVALAEVAVPETLRLESPTYAGTYDPHVWLSVPLWQQVVSRVAQELGQLAPDRQAAFQRRADTYRQELEDVHQYVLSRAAEVSDSQRVLITSHDAFGYFGETYGFDVRGLQGLSTALEAGTSDVQALAEFVASRRIPALFVESSVSERGIQAVREAVRARGFAVRIGGTLYGDALGGPGTGADTYVGMIRTNIDTIVDALLSRQPS